MSDLIKICPVRAELFHADGRADTTMLIVAFRKFVKVPKERLSTIRQKSYKHNQTCVLTICHH